MFAKYIIRLDDACPTMNLVNWNRLETLLDKYNICPIVAVVPNNKDKELMIDKQDDNFWRKVKSWQDRSWEIALHGYEHKYSTQAPSLVPINNYSEFSGLSLKVQKEKIRKGIEIFKEHNISTRLWVAPAHSFDENTIEALKTQSDIHIISDGIAFTPYWDYEMYWVPQQLWKFRKMFFGTWTACFHPDTMKENDFLRLEAFLATNSTQFITLESLTLTKRKKSIIEKLFEIFYWKMLERKRTK